MAEFVPGNNKLSFDANSFQGSNQTTGKMHGFKRLSFKVDYKGELKPLVMKSFMNEETEETLKRVSYVVLSTDDSLDPDKANENAFILDYQLLENEFLVKVERLGDAPSNQIGDPKQIFVNNERAWDIYTWDDKPRVVEITFAQGKEPNVKGVTLYSDDYENAYGIGEDGIRRGLTSITWNGGVFKVTPISLETTMVDLTNFPMLSMRYKHDGNVYELDSNKLVKTYGNQNITGKKIFKDVPQVTGEPIDANDVVTKAYVEENFFGTSAFPSGDNSVTGLIKASNNAGSYCAFSWLKWLLKDGTRLDIKMVENVLSTNATEPVLAVWHVVKDLGSSIVAPQKKSKQEIQDYELQEGEFKGTLSYFKVVGKYNGYSTPEPWAGYCCSGLTGQHEGMLAFSINNLVTPLRAIEMTVGNKGESWSYNFDTLQVIGKNGAKEYDVTYPQKAVNNQVVTVELPYSSMPELVTVTGEQRISGKKTFTGGVQSTSTPVDDADLINKEYADKTYVTAPASPEFKIDINCEKSSGYAAFSEFKITMANGKLMEPVYLEKREVRPDNNIYRFVYRLSDPANVSLKQTPRKTTDEFNSYVLKKGEYLGYIYYACHFNSDAVMNAYDTQTDPWWGYLFNGSTGNVTMCQLIFKELPVEIKSIFFKSGDKHNSFSYKANKYGAKFTYGAKSQECALETTQTTHEFFVDAGAISPEASTNCFVELVGDQSIKGVKTFITTPKVLSKPIDDKDVANKQYVDSVLGGGFDVTVTIKQAFYATWAGLSKLHFALPDGVLEAKYVEDIMPANAKEPALMVWAIRDEASATPVVQYKSKEEIKNYELQDGEFFGDITYAELLGPYKSHSATGYRSPFTTYLFNGGSLGQHPVIKVNVYSLKKTITSVRYLNGYNGTSYVGEQHAVDFVVNTKESGSSYTGTGVNDPFIFTPSNSNLFDSEKSNYVPIQGDIDILDVKTFVKAPKSLAEAVDGNDLITKDFATKNFLSRESKPRDFDILVKMKNDGTWVGFTQFKVLLSNGTRLDLKYLETGSAPSVTQPLVAVFKTVTDSAAPITAPERKAKTFFDSYNLEAGEYKGTVSFYKVVGKFNPASADINPWSVYVGNGNANNYDGIYGLHIDQLDKGLRGVNFKFGDAVSSSYTYTCQQCGVVFTTDLGSLEVEYKGDMTDSTEATIELPSDSAILGGFVTVDGEQTIGGAKTFNKVPKSLALPKDNTDLVNKSYVSNNFAPHGRQDWDIKIVFGYTSSTYNEPVYTGFSYLKPLLRGGGRLDIKYISSGYYASSTTPIDVIWKINPDADAPFTDPQSVTADNLRNYVLQPDEFRGTISFAKCFGNATVNSSLYRPWQCYAAKAEKTGQTIFGFTITDLTVNLSAISFLNGDCRPENNNGGEGATNNYYCFKATTIANSNNVEQRSDFSMDYGYAVPQRYKIGLNLDPSLSTSYVTYKQATQDLVTTYSNQIVRGLKTFETLPQTPSNKNILVSSKLDFVNRDYIDNNIPAALRTYKLALRFAAPVGIKVGQGWSIINVKLVLQDGNCITPYYVDSQGRQTAQNKCAVIWKVVPYANAVADPTQKTTEEINKIQLDNTMYRGLYYPKRYLFNSSGCSNLFTFKDISGSANDGNAAASDIFACEIFGLNIPLSHMEFSIRSSGQVGYISSTLGVDGASERSNTYTPKDKFEDGQIKDRDIVLPVMAKSYWAIPVGGGYATLSRDQSIDGFKSFAKSVSCDVVPSENAHLTNKKYVDEEIAKLVARIEALEAAKP